MGVPVKADEAPGMWFSGRASLRAAGPQPYCFFEMLSGFNNQLVADMIWRYYCVERFR
jgi:hypothetical protein